MFSGDLVVLLEDSIDLIHITGLMWYVEGLGGKVYDLLAAHASFSRRIAIGIIINMHAVGKF